MKLKNKSGTMVITCLTAVVLMTSGMAFGAVTTTLKTDKTVYLMDPVIWAYYDRSGIWQYGGNPRTVTFDVNIYDADGDPAEGLDVSFEAYDAAVLLASGAVTATGSPGVYQGSFVLTDADLGGVDFLGQVPKELTLKISTVAEGLIKEHPVSVGRWGCDRCHVEKYVGKYLYPWSEPSGGPDGPHNPANILGASRAHGGFTIDFLTDAENTHTPSAVGVLDVHPFHEKTERKLPWGVDACSPCHQGSGRVRYPYEDGVSMPWVSHAMSEAVGCTLCHGIEGGYVPAVGRWDQNTGYISEAHMHRTVPDLPHTPRDPYLANQSCANPGCHGHIDDDAVGEIQFNKPDCMKCHGIHNDDL